MTDYKKAVWVPSPNFDQGREGHTINSLVLHGTAGGGTVPWFSLPQSYVSAHYVVDKDGTVTQMVLEADTAWHAGEVPYNSPFYGQPNPNSWTIGIEFVRDINNAEPLPQVQVDAGADLVRDIFARRGRLIVLTHDEIEPGRICPGPGFPVETFMNIDADTPVPPMEK